MSLFCWYKKYHIWYLKLKQSNSNWVNIKHEPSDREWCHWNIKHEPSDRDGATGMDFWYLLQVLMEACRTAFTAHWMGTLHLKSRKLSSPPGLLLGAGGRRAQSIFFLCLVFCLPSFVFCPFYFSHCIALFRRITASEQFFGVFHLFCTML